MAKLTPQDIIDSAAIPDVPGAFVLGCYDNRITVYSQQVRALELAHALQKSHYVSSGLDVAVIGGGAAGMTIAAALALQGAQSVHLFERSRELMPLQRHSLQRRLDPHIYNWPAQGAENEEAELPILDWKSGAASDVRTTLVQQYVSIEKAVGGRLVKRCDSRVMSITSDGNAFEIAFERDTPDGGRETRRHTVDLVVLAIGFGLESLRSVEGIVDQTYWLDSGVPAGFVEGKARPSVAISGNGDGGLIDLIAAASRDFDHNTMIRLITRRANISRLHAPLLAVEGLARTAEARGEGFNFIAAYDREVGEIADALGLTDEIGAQMHPGIQIYLQTREKEVLSTRTATLNRLAVYLVKRVCDRSPRDTFNHVISNEVVLIPLPHRPAGEAPPPVDPEAPALNLDCDGHYVGVDRLVVRRGTQRDVVRQPFAEMLRSYPDAHGAWVARFRDAAIAPVLSGEAHGHFIERARAHGLQLSRHLGAEAAGGVARRIKLASDAGGARWSGDVLLDDVATVWDPGLPATAITVQSPPPQLESLAYAISRLALHAPGCTMHVNVARWDRFLKGLTIDSRIAEELELPMLRAVAGTSERVPVSLGLDAMAERLNRAMDRACLQFIDTHILGLLEREADPSYFADLRPAGDVAEQMLSDWTSWKAGFDADPELLSRYLRLLICARDSTDTACEAQTLVGPRKKKLLIRATAAALAVTAGWTGTAPHAREPGNLARPLTGDLARDHTGHVCAAERIDGQKLAVEAASFLWRTDFVLLPMISTPVAVALEAEKRFDLMDRGDPDFTGSGIPPSLMLSVDPGFQQAVNTGLEAVSSWLARAQATHSATFTGEIEAEREDDDEAAIAAEEADA